MKAKILSLVGLATAVVCIVGISIGTWKYRLFEDMEDNPGAITAIATIIVLLGLYVFAFLLKKQKLLWFVICAWFVLWVMGFALLQLHHYCNFLPGFGFYGLDCTDGFLLDLTYFTVVVVSWPMFVCEGLWGHVKLLDSVICLICCHIFITIFLCLGSLGLKRAKGKNNKTSEKALTDVKE